MQNTKNYMQEKVKFSTLHGPEVSIASKHLMMHILFTITLLPWIQLALTIMGSISNLTPIATDIPQRRLLPQCLVEATEHNSRWHEIADRKGKRLSAYSCWHVFTMALLDGAIGVFFLS
jgi:hypothetical protein